MLDRRSFLQNSLIAATATGVAARGGSAAADQPASVPSGPLVDTNVYLGRWPFRRIPGDDTGGLVRTLREHGVLQAWAGSYDGVFHKDIGAANAWLADQCRAEGGGLLVPFGAVNPRLPDWEEELRRCDEQYRMPGIRLHPNYHGYPLDDLEFARLLRMAAGRGLIVQLAAWLEDERHQHPLMPVAEVDLAPLAEVVRQVPQLRLVLLNANHVPWDRLLPELLDAGQVFWDLARLEVIEGLAALLQRVPADRLVFGSYSPMFNFESTLLKLPESAIVGAAADSILRDNARGLLVTAGGEARER